VRLLMWEIGKTSRMRKRSSTRTIDYITDTIGRPKELDGSLPVHHCPGNRRPGPSCPLGVALCMGPTTIRLTRPSLP